MSVSEFLFSDRCFPKMNHLHSRVYNAHYDIDSGAEKKDRNKYKKKKIFYKKSEKKVYSYRDGVPKNIQYKQGYIAIGI